MTRTTATRNLAYATAFLALILSGFMHSCTSFAKADTPDRISFLAARILERVPDIPATRGVLGRGNERPHRALLQARAIVRAADMYAPRWRAFVARGGWTHFNPERDLPGLIAALALRETYMQPLVRDEPLRIAAAPVPPAGSGVVVSARAARRTARRTARRQALRTLDRGVMQVRAPSRPAARCGVTTAADLRRLSTDLSFGYQVGTCVLTNRVDHFIEDYQRDDMRRLHAHQRPGIDLVFYGVWGPRQGTLAAARARELLVLERYNWGGRPLYNHARGAGYARRILQEYEFFNPAPEVSSAAKP